MKLINDDGEVIGEYEDSDGVLVFTKEGVVGILPNGPDDEDLPQHLLYCAATMVYVSEKEGRDEIQAFFSAKVSRSH